MKDPKIRHLVLAAILVTGFLTPVQSKLLKGEIDHSESLKPVESTLQPGSSYDAANLPVMNTSDANRWYRIPTWLAGTWRKETQTDFYRYNFRDNTTDTTTRTEPARSDGVWGTQMDDKGGVWQFDPTPFTANVDSGAQFVVQLVRTSEPLEVTDQKFVRRSITTQIRVNKATNKIASVESGEQITSYIPESEGLIKRETSAKVFDNEGQPILLGKSFAYETRIAPFKAQDNYRGKDMKLLFNQFMQTQNEAAFLPDQR